MALSFTKIEPVQFGDMVLTPKLDEELKLRVRGLKFDTVDSTQASIRIMSECFPEREEEVYKFIGENLSTIDMVMLKTYLADGESGLTMLKEAVSEELRMTLRQGITEAKNA